MASCLSGKVALVTGASRGIGREIALSLAAAGASVIAHFGTGRVGAEDLVREIEAAGGKAAAVGADLRAMSMIDELFEGVDRSLAAMNKAKIDILVNNAGVGGGSTLETVTPEQFDHLFEINVRGLVFVTQKAVLRMNEGGRVINISSMVSLAAYPDAVAYAMSKASVNSFTRSLAADLGRRGITVNAVAPGATDTDFIHALLEDPQLKAHYAKSAALGRIGTTQDIADVVAFLASEEGRWITGQVLEASGGMHL